MFDNPLQVLEKISSVLQEETIKANKAMSSWLDSAETSLKQSSSTEGCLDDIKERHNAIKVGHFTILFILLIILYKNNFDDMMILNTATPTRLATD